MHISIESAKRKTTWNLTFHQLNTIKMLIQVDFYYVFVVILFFFLLLSFVIAMHNFRGQFQQAFNGFSKGTG